MLLNEKVTICKMYYEIMVLARKDLLTRWGDHIIANHFNPKYTVLRSLLEGTG